MAEPKCKCKRCEVRDIEDQQAEETGMAFLIVLMPLLTITVFSSMGLI